MGITKFPAGISSQGVPVIGGSYYTTGTVFFVDSVTGSNGNSGTDKDHPFATIDYAVGRCTANKGDVIIVMPNHTETVTEAGGLDLDVAGITVVGLGSAAVRPIINLTTATTADIDVDAANITLRNVRIDMTGITAVAAGIDINASGFTLEDCDILMADSTGVALVGAVLAPGLDNVTIRNNVFHGLGASGGAGTAAITTDASASGCDFLTVEGNHFSGWYVTSCLNQTCAGEGWLIVNNHFENFSDTGAAPTCVTFGATGSDNHGTLAYNTFRCGTSGSFGTMLDGGIYGDLGCFENYGGTMTDDMSGILCPIVVAVS